MNAWLRHCIEKFCSHNEFEEENKGNSVMANVLPFHKNMLLQCLRLVLYGEEEADVASTKTLKDLMTKPYWQMSISA